MQNFRKPIKLLAVSMTDQNNNQVVVPTNRNDRSMAARVCDLFRMNPSKFLGSHIGKDQKKFIDEIKKIFGVKSIDEIGILQTQGCDSHMVHSVERQ